MKKQIFFLIFLFFTINLAFPAKHVIANNGTTFSPNSITINVGDTVVFNLGGNHNAVEVSEGTYSANGNTSNGGFQVGFGGGTVVFPTAGTFYFVCEPHASLGMKGIIHVQSVSSLKTVDDIVRLNTFPNPSDGNFSISYYLNSASLVGYKIVNLAGQTVYDNTFEKQEAGWQKFEVGLSGQLSKGIYLLDITINNTKLARKLIIN